MEMTDSTSDELYQRAFKRCLPHLIRDLDFDGTMDHIVSREMFTDVQIRDMQEKPTTTEKIRSLIYSLIQEGYGVYEMFLECLTETSQEELRTALENKYSELDKKAKEEEREIEDQKLKVGERDDRSPCSTPEKENVSPGQGQTLDVISNVCDGVIACSKGFSPRRMVASHKNHICDMSTASNGAVSPGHQSMEARSRETIIGEAETSSTECSNKNKAVDCDLGRDAPPTSYTGNYGSGGASCLHLDWQFLDLSKLGTSLLSRLRVELDRSIVKHLEAVPGHAHNNIHPTAWKNDIMGTHSAIAKSKADYIELLNRKYCV